MYEDIRPMRVLSKTLTRNLVHATGSGFVVLYTNVKPLLAGFPSLSVHAVWTRNAIRATWPHREKHCARGYHVIIRVIT